MKLLALALVAVVLLVACTPRPRVAVHMVATSTVTTAMAPSTTVHTQAPPRASRSARRVAPSAPGPAGDPSDAFWRRLANCESSDGRGGNGGGYFQFSPDTARKVGYFVRATYAQQLAMAKSWLAQIGGRGGSRSGWPQCWWVAGGGGGGAW